MSFLSAGIGAGLGFIVGGPIGAALGLFIGSSMGSKNKKRIGLDQKNKTLFFVSLFSMLAKMAKADGVVSKQEIAAVNSFIAMIRLDEEDKKTAIDIFRNAKSDQYSIYEYADQYRTIANEEMREMIYSALWQVAHSDGEIHKNEDYILRNIYVNLGLRASIYNEYSQRVQGNEATNTDHYKIIECSSDSSDDEVKKAYRKAIAKYHPDKIQSKGLPKEFIKLANEKSKKINQAYNAIKKQRGMT
jgi:DnaJ like chaperone protein